jgi:hypothetical protein
MALWSNWAPRTRECANTGAQPTGIRQLFGIWYGKEHRSCAVACAYDACSPPDGVRARRLIHSFERTVTPARDGSSEEQAARVPTNAGLARNCTLVPQVSAQRCLRSPPKNHTSMVFSTDRSVVYCCATSRGHPVFDRRHLLHA